MHLYTNTGILSYVTDTGTGGSTDADTSTDTALPLARAPALGPALALAPTLTLVNTNNDEYTGMLQPGAFMLMTASMHRTSALQQHW